jgi:hypothetical protein
MEQQEEEYQAKVDALEKVSERLKVAMAGLHERKEKVLRAGIEGLKEERGRYQGIIYEKARHLKELDRKVHGLESAPNQGARDNETRADTKESLEKYKTDIKDLQRLKASKTQMIYRNSGHYRPSVVGVGVGEA